MKKFYWILLNIFTFGTPYLITRQKAKKIATTTNSELKVTNKINFDIDKLINTFGGVDNIVDISATISTLKINLNDATNLIKEQFLPFKSHGFMKNHNQIILVFGDNSQAICDVIQSKINHNAKTTQ